jgi:hypothetical protein
MKGWLYRAQNCLVRPKTPQQEQWTTNRWKRSSWRAPAAFSREKRYPRAPLESNNQEFLRKKDMPAIPAESSDVFTGRKTDP